MSSGTPYNNKPKSKRETRVLEIGGALCLLLALLSCGGDKGPNDPGTSPNPEQQSVELLRQVVTPDDSATLVSQSGEVQLAVPAGAVETAAEISIRRVERSDLPAGALGGVAFELEPDGLQFSVPVTLSIALEPGAESQSGGFLRVVQILDDGSWLPVAAAKASEAGVVSAELSHFSSYALVDLALTQATRETVRRRFDAVDVLFVVDNSGSMLEEQENLARNFPQLVDRLEAAEIDYRVGVVTSDLGTAPFAEQCEAGEQGRLATTPGEGMESCQMPIGPWLERTQSGTNAPGDDLRAAFSCMARRGTSGCGFEQTLESMYRALDPTTNPNFIREQAALAVVIISDEDDCSAKDPGLFDPRQLDSGSALGAPKSFRCFEFGVTCDVDDRMQSGERKDCQPREDSYLHGLGRYVERLRQLKPDGSVAVSVIAGSADRVAVGRDQDDDPALLPSCDSANGTADPAIRLTHFARAFGSRGLMSSICDGDLGPAMSAVGELVAEQSRLDWCLPFEVIDVDPETPELEGDCEVSVDSRSLELCESEDDTTPCFRLRSSEACQGTGIRLNNIAVDQVGGDITARCLAED